MQTIPLANTGRNTTRLGFGCSSLMSATSRRDSLRLLETAYDVGIRHFDVAPMYGYGEAESCLGEFLQAHRGQVTVTTKYGIAPPRNSSLLRAGRRLAGPLLKTIPSLKKTLAQAANAATRHDARPTFTAAQAKASLDRSLATLRTGHIDLWLLHEVTASDLEDASLLDLLQAEVRHGTIGSFGIGSSADKIPLLLAERPAYCSTLQYEWSVLDTQIPDKQIPDKQIPDKQITDTQIKPFRIHHRALTDNFRDLHTALVKNKPLCQRWSQAVNNDLSQADVLANLMLKAALVINPASIILFSSKNHRHILVNVDTAADPTLDQPARQLYNLIQAERDQLLPVR